MTDTPDTPDIVERIHGRWNYREEAPLAYEAADEITRLRAELAETRLTIKLATQQARAAKRQARQKARVAREKTVGLRGFSGRPRTPTRLFRGRE